MDETPKPNQALSKPQIELSDVLTASGLVAIAAGAWMRFGLDIALLTVGGLVFGLGVFVIIWSTR